VLLPVRDEAANLVDCVATLLHQSGEPTIRIVDDGSTDATPRLLADLAASSRIEALRARPLAPGWTGKVNALASGFDGVSTEWTLLTDADTRHAPDLLARAHAATVEAPGRRLDALSLAGTQEARGPGENLVTPTAFALLDLLLGDWRPHARGEAASPLANGQFVLVRTEALRAIGGFAAIVGQPLDDVALARALHAGGYRVGFRRAGDGLRVRMYRGLGESMRGWRRNLALILGDRPAVVARATILALSSVLVLAALAAAGDVGALASAWCGGALASGIVRQSSGNNPFAGLLFPLDLCALSVLLLVARRDHRRRRLTPWRGRTLTLD
jgi:glycosyltransferase involved in cell wall biosynthesis